MANLGRIKIIKDVGWETDNSSIVFSMSSQLWFNFNFESIKKYIIADVIVDNSKKRLIQKYLIF